MSATDKLIRNGIDISLDELNAIAVRYHVVAIDVFGSALRSDMRPDSDVDLLVSFDGTAAVSLFDIMDMEQELSELFHRPVDIVEPEALRNPIRRKNILGTKEPLYAA